MERSEKVRILTIKRGLHKSLGVVDELLRQAEAPRRLSKADVKHRAQSICKAVAAKGGAVSREHLQRIADEHRLPFAAIGSLVGAGYLRTTKTGFRLGARGQAAKRHKKGRPTR